MRSPPKFAASMHRVGVVCALLFGLTAPVAPAQGQAPSGPTLAFGPGFGRLHGGKYTTTTLTGLHLALSVPVHQATSLGVMVLGFTADMFWDGNGDVCVIDPSDLNRCLPSPPNLTAMTVGWRGLVFGRQNMVFHVAAGRISGRGEVTGGGFARLEFVPRSGHFGFQAFGQYSYVPSFQNVTLQPLVMGFSFYVH